MFDNINKEAQLIKITEKYKYCGFVSKYSDKNGKKIPSFAIFL